ncbi:cupredoxin domain-containing protein [Nitrososphaera viennensis]|uniref:Cupredoxin domain-containing protein n=1 Tax=Nitrososphaera viennensis TaxID=1034015 RepID=A0A977IBT4_9ARCH|nr:plastocyanin/azurin family copper-binding protein [Nitrososphaera viennensis]UVS68084.1 cupredoxin domain-containing protein [Nitrososphaera viennensis]
MPPAAAGLAIGIGLIVLFAVFAPSMPLKNPNAGFLAFADCSQPLAVASGQTGQTQLKERTWISVAKLSALPKVGKVKCTAISQELLAKFPVLKEALKGADGCADGTEVCEVSYGMSSSLMDTSLGISVPDREDYELSVTKAEAEAIAGELGISEPRRAILSYNDSLYVLYLRSAGTQDVSAQMESKFVEPVSFVPVPLEKGRSLNYTLTIKTWATYGGPVEIDLNATASARDSGLDARFEPSRLVIPERSEASTRLVIRAGEDAKDGVYRIRIGGSINHSLILQDSPCKYGSGCPIVKIGASEWGIENYGSDQYIGLGGRQPPEWLKATVETDKDAYSAGEDVKISAHLANEGAQAITLDNDTRLILTIYDDSNKYNENVYTIDSYIFGLKEPIVVEPGSKILLARAFQWDQKTFGFGVAPHDVEQGRYSIGMSFAGYNASVFHTETQFRIGLGSISKVPGAGNGGTDSNSGYNGTMIIIPRGLNGAEASSPPFYEPEEAHVKAGEEIRWKNEDGALHTATSSTPSSEDTGKLFDTDIIPPNRFSHPVVIKDPGEYSYFCQLHPWMSGKIIIVEPRATE